MDKKGLLGAKVFGVLFILLAAYLINYPIGEMSGYSPTCPYNPSKTIYRSYRSSIASLEDFQKDATTPATSKALKDFQKCTTVSPANQILFAQKLAQLKQEAETFRQVYIVKGRIPLHSQIFISIGFATSMIFLIAGLGLILNFRWSRQVAMWSMALNPIFYLSVLTNVYLLIDFSNFIILKVTQLQAILEPSAINQLKFLLQDNFKLIFLAPIMWLWFLPLVLLTIFVLYYFTRPAVKAYYK